jgi:large subunit ribosomal protein L25
MANEHKIDINKRELSGKQGIKQIRREGNIPGVYYSPNSESSIPIVISKAELNAAIKSGARIFNISVGDKKQNVLFKSVQYHPVTDKILHVDLYGIRMDRPVNIKVAVSLIGDPIGVIEGGGVLNQAASEIEVICLPGDIPEFFEADISNLNLGESLNAGSIELSDKYTLVTPEDAALASVTMPMKESEPETVEDGDEEFMDEEGESKSDADGSGDKESSDEEKTE